MANPGQSPDVVFVNKMQSEVVVTSVKMDTGICWNRILMDVNVGLLELQEISALIEKRY